MSWGGCSLQQALHLEKAARADGMSDVVVCAMDAPHDSVCTWPAPAIVSTDRVCQGSAYQTTQVGFRLDLKGGMDFFYEHARAHISFSVDMTPSSHRMMMHNFRQSSLTVSRYQRKL